MDGQTILKIARAYSSGDYIGTFEVNDAIKQLPCYGFYALRPGNELCDNARKFIDHKMIESQDYVIPNRDRVLPEVCLACPVFAPAITALVALLPAQQ